MKDTIPFQIPTTFCKNDSITQEEKPLTIAQCKVKFSTYKLNVERRSSKTVESYEGEIDRFMRFLGQKGKGPLTPINEVTEEIVEEYIAYANTKKRKWEDHRFNSTAAVDQIGLKATTVNNMRRYLSGFFNWLVKRSLISENPAAHIEQIAEDEQGYGYVLEKSEIFRLVQQPNRRSFNGFRDVTLIQVLVDTGMRLGQCMNLRVKDVILEDNKIRIRPEITKTKKGRDVAITPGTAHMLGILIQSMETVTSEKLPWLWITEQKTKLSSSTFSKQLKRYTEKAGPDPKRVHPHAFRHFSAIQHRRNGASVDQIQALLDHKSILTTMIYLSHFEHDMRELNDKFSPAHELVRKPGRKKGHGKLELAANAELSVSENII
ncbi:tyrosine-type recombinase/integrase [Alicyclobacillus hesperidum]|uniref:tyrosine-type recombinase/integrase n=1 Tax=Alicyclobacillus hesperidum TaxID=89784 RepID=UPI0002D2AD5E|nr:site-specific integrase [Alicyclobacillus hesperidum]